MLKLKSKFYFGLVLTFFLTAAVSPAFAAQAYSLDKVHSSIGFGIKHLVVSTTKGEFTDYTSDIMFDPSDLENSKIDVTVQASSIDTRNADRDKHLKSADFFDVEKFPTLSFSSTKIVQSGEQYQVTGNLTIHGVTQEVTIPLMISGPIMSPFGFEAIGISADFQLNRKDYGITWNKALDSGGVMVGEDVKVSVNLEAHSK